MEGHGLRAPYAPPLCEARWWPRARLSLFFAALLFSLPASGSLPRYRLGELATNEVVAPFEFAVVNHQGTERLRREELAKVPAVYRCDPWAAVQAEEKFTTAFHTTRAAFLQAMETAAKRRVLDETTIAHPSFWRFVEWFGKQHPDFPLTTNVVTAWALGRDEMELTLRSALRETMARFIRGDVVPAAADTTEVQLLITEHSHTRITLDDLRARGQIVPSAEVLPISAARTRVKLPQELAEFTPYLGKFIRENVVFEEWLTTLKRQGRAAELVVFDQYSPGQVVVLAGQVIDTRAAAALDVLAAAEARREVRRPVENAAPPAGKAASVKMRATVADLQRLGRQHPWLGWLIAGLVLMAAWRLLARRPPPAPPAPMSEAYTVIMNPARNETVFLPVSAAPSAADAPSKVMAPEPAEMQTRSQWQAQLREAEQRAEDLLAMVRAGLAPHLAKELTHRLVQELVSHRTTLLRAHHLAEREITSLESRFEKVCGELHERIASYEKRTVELEKELSAKTEQTRELMNATILLTQQKLVAKKAGDKFACN